MVEGRDEGLAFVLACLHGRTVRFVERVTRKDDLDGVAAEHAYLIDLLLGCSYGHEYLARDAELVAREGYALCVVARAGADDAFGRLVGRERPDHVVRAAYLVRTHNLKILALEHHVGLVSIRQVAVRHQRCGRQYLAEGVLGGHDVV